jgi:hypothetical protein
MAEARTVLRCVWWVFVLFFLLVLTEIQTGISAAVKGMFIVSKVLLLKMV